jgi:hypothetical protein
MLSAGDSSASASMMLTAGGTVSASLPDHVFFRFRQKS